MSAYEDAEEKAALTLADQLGHALASVYPAIPGPNTLRIARAVLASYRAALPPSIVVDGKVAELGEAVTTWLDGNDDPEAIASFLDAAREVAE